MAHDRRRFEGRLVIAIGHRRGRLFMHTGDELGRPVLPVDRDGLMQPQETRPGIRRTRGPAIS